MKRKLLLTLTCLLVTTVASVQAKEKPLKIGYANLEYIISQLPDTKRAQAEYKSFEKQVKNKIEAKLLEFQEKLQAIQKGYENMTDEVKKQKETELRQIQTDLQEIESESQQSLTDKQVALFKPVYEKIQQAVQRVAKEKEYTHIFNTDGEGMSVLLYAVEEYDVSELVLRKLGINPADIQSKKADTVPNKAATAKTK
ncbi:MAG: OmpH family outer membrane protein [Bacteroidota bacterium]